MNLVTRVFNLILGLVNLVVAGIEKQQPEALLELEKENLRKLIVQYNEGLVSHAALCERLMSQVQHLETEERELGGKTSANLRVGNRGAAGQFALRLQSVQRELDENRNQLQQAEKTYQKLVRAREITVNEAKAKIEALRRDLGDLKIKRATAELTEMAAGMVSKLSSSSDTFSRLHNMVDEEREQAAGRVRVAKDMLQDGDLDLQEAEQQALAEQALADFSTREGIAIDIPVLPPSVSSVISSKKLNR